MISILFVAVSQFFAELSTSLGKYEFEHSKESLYAMGFLSTFWTTIFFVVIGYSQGGFVFSLASLPTFIPRVILEVVLTFITLHAVLDASRSTFTFLRTLTIPFLVVIDITLGYPIGVWRIVGVLSMIASFMFLYVNHGLSAKGKVLTLISALMSVATISLYQYDIKHFNSVAAEQAITNGIVVCVLAVGAWYRLRENVFATLKEPVFFAQSIASGLSGVFMSFAYLYGPASIITSLKRAFEVLGSVIAGRYVFHESDTRTKLIALALMAIGVWLAIG
jgi:hypothetical protein